MWLAEGLDAGAWGAALAGLEGGGGETLQAGRHLTERMRLEVGGKRVDTVLKTYGKQAGWRDWAARKLEGSKAARSMAVALRLKERGVGTPEPLAAVEVWRGGRLARCQFLTRTAEGLSDFRAELTEALSRKPARCEEIIDLLQTVADGVRGLHEAGVAHGDLGNQNIALQRVEAEDEGWHKGWRVLFLDLNRARVKDALTDAERGRDLSRLDIPSDLRRVFFAMIHGGDNPPEAFLAAEKKARAAFDRHTATRKWRHPIRQARIRAAERANPPKKAPEGPELWIWDGRSGQPVQAYVSRDRRKWQPAANVGMAVGAWLARGIKTERLFNKLLAGSFAGGVEMDGVAGVSLEWEDAAAWERQLAALGKLDAAGGTPTPVLVRIYAHAGEAWRKEALERARELASGGRGVALALVQDRASVSEPGRWAAMVRDVVGKSADFAEFFEVGHAPNRCKWGVWDYHEAAGLWAGLREVAVEFPEVKLAGPSCIDFEPYAVLPMMGMLPKDEGFWAPSAELYVDRRGAPENRQGRHDAVSKAAWLRAAARASGAKWADDRLVVTEVNWPLVGTGAWSPVCSPYDTTGPRKNDPSVDEDACAAYLARYVLLAACSGHVSRVYWWRLAAHGYGLVDIPPEGGQWRERPAFASMAELRRRLVGTKFEQREDAADGRVILHFSRGGERFSAAWNPRGDGAPEWG
jgi:hypothetical protein